MSAYPGLDPQILYDLEQYDFNPAAGGKYMAPGSAEFKKYGPGNPYFDHMLNVAQQRYLMAPKDRRAGGMIRSSALGDIRRLLTYGADGTVNTGADGTTTARGRIRGLSDYYDI